MTNWGQIPFVGGEVKVTCSGAQNCASDSRFQAYTFADGGSFVVSPSLKLISVLLLSIQSLKSSHLFVYGIQVFHQKLKGSLRIAVGLSRMVSRGRDWAIATVKIGGDARRSRLKLDLDVSYREL